MNKFGNRQDAPADNFGQEGSQQKACCLNETTRFDVTLVYKDGNLVQVPYNLQYVAYLKCQKKCKKDSFETSENAGAPTPRDGEVFLWATRKETEECTLCSPGSILDGSAFRVEQCSHKGDHLFGGVQTPPPTADEIRIVQDFINEMLTNPPSEKDIKDLMDQFIQLFCNKAECTLELKTLCRTVKK